MSRLKRLHSIRGARAKHSGNPCRSPAVYGKRRCRIHGGGKGSGGQRGNTNALKYGLTTGEAKGFRRMVKQLLKESSEIAELLVANATSIGVSKII